MDRIVLWCDSDPRVGESATVLTDEGIDVHTFTSPEELLRVYEQVAHHVVGVISSMMEGGGRKERLAMNAFGLFAACKERSYAIGARPPVLVLVSGSADRDVAFAAGADAVVLTGNRRQCAQQLLLAKARGISEAAASVKRVLWCDSADVSYTRNRFAAAGYNLETFQTTKDMLDVVDTDVVAIISSTMEADRHMNAFRGFAAARAALEETSARPLYVLVSSSSKTSASYRQGVDIAACKDNEQRKRRHQTGGLRDHAISDFLIAEQVHAKSPTAISAEDSLVGPGHSQHIEVRSISGDFLFGPVDLSRVFTVAELKDCMQKEMGLAGGLQLSLGSTYLQDSDKLSSLQFDDVDDIKALTAVLATGPTWYPPSKYTHEGKDVISFHVRSDVRGRHGRGGTGRRGTYNVTVNYTDGSFFRIKERRGSRSESPVPRLRRQEDPEPVTNPAPTPKPVEVPLGGGFEDELIKEWGFIKYVTSSFGYEDIVRLSYVAVPPEDPDEWVEIETDYDDPEAMCTGTHWIRKKDLPQKGKVEKHETSGSYDGNASRRRGYGGR